jgi:ABC-2 type transport system ATP-binding protein
MQVDKLEEFTRLVEDLDFVKEIFIKDSEIKLMVERGENLVAELVNFANKNNIFVYSIELEHPNLEDVFLKYTGRTIQGKDKMAELEGIYTICSGRTKDFSVTDLVY